MGSSQDVFTILVLYAFVMVIVTLLLVQMALQAIFSAAVYRYAAGKEVVDQFDETVLRNAFRPRRSSFATRIRRVVRRTDGRECRMIPDLFANQDGEFVVSLLLSRIGLALLYMIIAVVALDCAAYRATLGAGVGRDAYGGIERATHNTIARLMRTLTKVAIFAVAAVAVLSLFVDSAGLFTFLGLFTAAIGFSLRELIGDYISGFVFLFEDLFAIGDHVEVGGERGTVEDVTMRTTMLRAPSGETRLVPNGEIRTVYNYPRATVK